MGDHHPEPRRPGRITGSSVLTPPTGIPLIPADAAALLVPPPADVAVPCAEPAPAPATPIPAEVAAPAIACLCGHEAAAHEHWRRGSDCGVCGAASCASFRRRGGALRRLLRALRLVR